MTPFVKEASTFPLAFAGSNVNSLSGTPADVG